jgi:hypothetical protein
MFNIDPNTISNIDNVLNTVGQRMEAMFREAKECPQHKYFTLPIYKTCAKKIGSVAATGVTFLAADLILHQLAPQVLICLAHQIAPDTLDESWPFNNTCNISWNYKLTLAWIAYALPVMYAKYKRE